MIRFSCVYCGKKLTAKDKYAGKKGICPACKHTVFIRKVDVTNKTLETPEEDKALKKDAKYWESKTDAQVAAELLEDKEKVYYKKKEEQQIKTMKRIFRFMIPTYDEIALFTFSMAFMILFLMSPAMREDIINVVIMKYGARLAIIFLIFLAGIIMSLFNIFIERRKYDYEKFILLFFAVYVSAGTGIYSGYIMLKSANGAQLLSSGWNVLKEWQLFFPFWNIINSFALLMLFRLRVIDIHCVVDEKSNYVYILISIVTVVILLCLCNYTFKLHWAISYSICICYTMSLLSSVQDLFEKTLSLSNKTT